MSIRPRREERAAVVELLESEQFETPDQLADAIIKKVYELFGWRDWRIWAHGDREGQLLLYGPFSQEREATKLATHAALGGENRVYRVLPPAPLARRLSDGTSGTCRCGHLKGVHEHNKSGTCWAGQLVGKKWQRTCGCTNFQEGAA